MRAMHESFQQFQQRFRQECVLEGKLEGRREGLFLAIETASELLGLPVSASRRNPLRKLGERELVTVFTSLRGKKRWSLAR